MARVLRNFGRNIVYKLAPQFSRGATAFAPVAFPGRIRYTGTGMLGLDNVAPVQRQFVTGDKYPQKYRHDTYPLINPAKDGQPFHSGTTRNYGLMPLVNMNAETPSNSGGNPDNYNLVAEEWDN